MCNFAKSPFRFSGQRRDSTSARTIAQPPSKGSSLFEILRNFWHSNKMCSGNGGEILHRRREGEGESQDRRAYDEIKLAKKCNFGTIQDCLTQKDLRKLFFQNPQTSNFVYSVIAQPPTLVSCQNSTLFRVLAHCEVQRLLLHLPNQMHFNFNKNR